MNSDRGKADILFNYGLPLQFCCHLIQFYTVLSLRTATLNKILVLLTYLHQNTATLFKPGGLFQVDKTCQKHAPNCTINNIKMQKALTVGGWTPPSHTLPPPPPSLGLGRFAPSQAIFTDPPKIKSWLRHWARLKQV